MKSPLVSIAMPAYNAESTIGEAIASILCQSFTDWELLIIDDGSTDRTSEVLSAISDPRVRVISGGINKGLPTRLNESVVLARGTYFARMDADDVSYPDRLQKQVEYLRAHPNVDLLGGSILIFSKNGLSRGLRKIQEQHQNICGPIWRLSVLPHVTWMGKREWFETNPYRESATHSQDRDLLTRTRRTSTFAALPDVLVGVREEGLTIRKQVPARMQFVWTLCIEAMRQFSPSLLLIAIPLEFAKLALDMFSIITGMDYTLLRHRMPPLTSADSARWDIVWKIIRTSAPQHNIEVSA